MPPLKPPIARSVRQLSTTFLHNPSKIKKNRWTRSINPRRLFAFRISLTKSEISPVFREKITRGLPELYAKSDARVDHHRIKRSNETNFNRHDFKGENTSYHIFRYHFS